MIRANNPSLKSWLPVPQNSDFPIQNIPFGIGKIDEKPPRVCSRIGDQVIDLLALAKAGLFKSLSVNDDAFDQSFLNTFMALGKPTTNAVRNHLSSLFDADGDDSLSSNESLQKEAIHPLSDVQMLMPVKVGDYTDFYSSREHATNLGMMFRDPENALLPNWLHIPVGYHGRASSIVVSGTNVRRPKGQTKPVNAEIPVFGPSKILDFELEMAFVVGKSTTLGEPINIDNAEEHIFGLCLFNDWSARDIQKWEYVPLGPFLGKSFASTVSPWIVTLEALDHFRISGPEQTEPAILPYLEYSGNKRYDINLEVSLQPEGEEATVISQSNFKNMYWNMCQQLTHHTVNGCNVNVGDMCASGTISGPNPGSFGSMLEIAWGGKKPLQLPNNIERKSLQDGDTLTIKGFGEKDGVRIGFGEVTGKILPAK